MKKLVLVLTIALVGVAAWSQSYEDFVRKELAGVPGFKVSVSVSPDGLASLLPISSIKTDVELKLRIAHIPVIPEDSSLVLNKAGLKGLLIIGWITVSVDGVRSSSGLWAISLRAECTQTAELMRDSSISTTGLTWHEDTIAMYGENVVPQLRETIKDWIDEFVNLYLSANP
jgi:hypothetical protein